MSTKQYSSRHCKELDGNYFLFPRLHYMQEKTNSFIKIDRTSCTMREKEKEEKEKRRPSSTSVPANFQPLLLCRSHRDLGPFCLLLEYIQRQPICCLGVSAPPDRGLALSFSLALYIFWFLITTIS
jgi:hypothetical protein